MVKTILSKLTEVRVQVARYLGWLVALAVVLALAVAAYYAWKVAVRREFTAEAEKRGLQAHVASLAAENATLQRRVEVDDARVKELEAQLASHERVEKELRRELEQAKAAEAEAAEEVAALPADALSQRVIGSLGPEAAFLPPAESRIEPPAVVLNEHGMRAVETLRVDRDGCRKELGIAEALNQNCGQQTIDLRGIADQRRVQVADLMLQVNNQKKMLELEAARHRLELKQARGTWLRRAWEKVDGPVLFVAGAVGGVLIAK